MSNAPLPQPVSTNPDKASDALSSVVELLMKQRQFNDETRDSVRSALGSRVVAGEHERENENERERESERERETKTERENSQAFGALMIDKLVRDS